MALRSELIRRVRSLPGVREHLDAARGTRSWLLEADPPAGGAAGTCFARMHEDRGGSVHLHLPPHVAEVALRRGWGERHPHTGVPLVFGPRNLEEMEVVWDLLRAAYLFARGMWAMPTREARSGDG